MNLRSRAIIKEIKILKELRSKGSRLHEVVQLMSREDWWTLAQSQIPRHLQPFLQPLLLRLRKWPAEKFFLRRFRWVRLTQTNAEIIIPSNRWNKDEHGQIDHAALVEGSQLMMKQFLVAISPLNVRLSLQFLKTEVDFFTKAVLPRKSFIRLTFNWDIIQRESFLYELREFRKSQLNLHVDVADQQENIVARIEHTVSIESQQFQEISNRRNDQNLKRKK